MKTGCFFVPFLNVYIKRYLPLTAKFPFSETSNLLVAGMRRTSNWTEPDKKKKQMKVERQRNMKIILEVIQ